MIELQAPVMAPSSPKNLHRTVQTDRERATCSNSDPGIEKRRLAMNSSVDQNLEHAKVIPTHDVALSEENRATHLGVPSLQPSLRKSDSGARSKLEGT